MGKSWWNVTFKSLVVKEGVKEWVQEKHTVYSTQSSAAACAMARHMKPLGDKMTLHVEAER
jgi:hypothetical protein